ncbi:MAG: hypothetical protein PUC30_12040 [Lachnospiraceae bacterium]|nr:hypothetical protein [Lachnospiraceae bacterium]
MGVKMKVLYTGFKGKNNSSYQLLSKISGQKLFLTNSYDGLKKDIMNVTDQYDLVVMFGVDTSLKDAVRIESIAEWEGEERATKIDCDEMCRCLIASGVQCVISGIPTKYLCNVAYFHMLQKVSGKAVFIHIPSLKNMSEGMVEKIVKYMEEIENV